MKQLALKTGRQSPASGSLTDPLSGLAAGLALVRAKPNLRPVCITKDVELKRGCVHEITGIATDSFTACLLEATSGHIVWIGRGRDVRSVCPLAAQRFFDPNRLITTECISRQEILWASEQALRSKGSDCVIIHLAQGPDLKESRRLQLAAEQGRSLGLIIIERTAQSSAAQTRWQCNPAQGENAANDTKWHWQLTKNKNGQLGAWYVSRGDDDAAHNVDKVRTTAA